jgi:hypothetical protein
VWHPSPWLPKSAFTRFHASPLDQLDLQTLNATAAWLRASPRLALLAVLAASAGAVGAGWALPVEMVRELMRESGPVENATVLFYGIAIGSLWWIRNPLFGNAAALAGTVVMTACMAREVSLRRLLLEAGLVSDHAFFVALAGLLVLLVVFAAGWLLVRYRMVVAKGLWRGRPAAVTLAVLGCTLVFSQIMDRLPEPARGSGHALSVRAQLVALSLEEVLELMLPVLVILAAVQGAPRAP